MKKVGKKPRRWMMVYSFCLVNTMILTASDQKVVHGYIDRMNPAVILLEHVQGEIIVEENALPIGSKEGKWVNMKKINDSYEIMNINEDMTKERSNKIEKLHEKLRSNKF